MAERNVSRILGVFGIIIQVIYNIAFFFLAIIVLVAIALTGVFNPTDPLLEIAGNLMGTLMLSAVAGTILFIIWIIFLVKPSKLKIGMIITGIIAMIICGILPGYNAFLLMSTPVTDITEVYVVILIFLGALPGFLVLLGGILAKETMVA